MIEYEDEDIELNNSPLDQYLNNLNFTNSENDKVDSIVIQRESSYQFKWIIFQRIENIINRIKKYFLMEKFNVLLNHARNMHILDEEDEISLQYLINTRAIHLDNLSEKFQINSKVKMFTFLVLIFCCFITLDKAAVACVVVIFLFGWLVLLIIYSCIIKHLILQFFDQITIISRQSRQIILLIQELLSINQGYARVVTCKDDENYDCSKSFNVNFLQEMIKKVYLLLCDFLNESQRLNEGLQKLCTQQTFCPSEVSWLREKCDISSIYLFQQEFNVNKPLNELKSMHNLIQSQFSFSIKRIVLWTLSVKLHPSLQALMIILPSIYQYNHIRTKFNECFKLLQYKTQNNIAVDLKLYNAKSFECYNRKKLILTSIQSLNLHLFEISEFMSQFSLELEESKFDCNIFESHKEKLEKCNFHMESLYNVWFTMFNEGKASLNEDNYEFLRSKGPQHLETKENDNSRDILLIEGEREIVDEVLEGVPLDVEFDQRDSSSYNELDTFVEKSKRNANLLLNELKSVIEIKAEEWKKREKIALERRAAEGKFVFNEGKTVMDGGRPDNIDCIKEKEEIKESKFNESLDLGFMKSFSDMILKQRRNMILESSINLEEEECFED